MPAGPGPAWQSVIRAIAPSGAVMGVIEPSQRRRGTPTYIGVHIFVRESNKLAILLYPMDVKKFVYCRLKRQTNV